jgi:hypothetical protein
MQARAFRSDEVFACFVRTYFSILQLVQFVTGTSNVPLEGFSSLQVLKPLNFCTI